MSDKIIGLYSIEGFDTRLGLGMGRYGFSITLAEPIVKALLNTKRDDFVPLAIGVKERLVKSHKKDYGGCHVEYYADTWLIRSIRVEGDCACFGIDGSTVSALTDKNRERNIKYNPHNIDSPEQAAIILSAWLLWFNHIICLTDFEQPFAI